MLKNYFFVIDKKKLLIIIILIIFLVGCIEQIERIIYGVNPGVFLEGASMEGKLRSEVAEEVNTWANKINREPQDADIEKGSGEFISEVYGKEVQIEATVDAVMNAHKNDNVKLRIEDVEPNYTVEDLRKITKDISNYSTALGGGAGGRVENIRLASKTINYTLLYPGDIFSFNGIVGDTTYEKGYKPAPILSGDGSVFLGPGGGVCQVASTIYNAVLNGNFKVIERYPHSEPVGYVPPGRDATIAYPYLDLKFQNNRHYPVILRAETNYSVIIRLLGPED